MMSRLEVIEYAGVTHLYRDGENVAWWWYDGQRWHVLAKSDSDAADAMLAVSEGRCDA